MSCQHHNLVLLHEAKPRLRCRHCHLTIKQEDIGDGYCPECFELTGEKRYDFEPVEQAEAGPVKYRCEDCGAIIE